ncbi:BsuBI/PstI family type II restriction endonuclease [Micromonospora chersina]|uniref:BsuBI/PstI family type II restriction endonuclease n=1 Tax=Micromonospora chersina TaxID=47854 RepID=UPI0036C15E80
MHGDNKPDDLIESLLTRAELARSEAAGGLRADSQRELGQFFTPRPVAERVAADPRLPEAGTLRILDPGAGTGSLTAALVARILRERPCLRVEITAVEVDPSLHAPLEQTLKGCVATADALGANVEYYLVAEDFVAWASRQLPSQDLFAVDGPDGPRFDIVIQNPPYKKINSNSAAKRMLTALGVDVPNIYAAFLALGADLLADEGQLVAITPRSFANGAYFRPFRRRLLSTVGIDRISVFAERRSLFADSSVLQENIIFTATRGEPPTQAVIATSRGYVDGPKEMCVSYADIVRPGDPDEFIHIPTDDVDHETADLIAALPATLADLGLGVATGRVVDFRAREALRDMPSEGTAPLIYPGHLQNGRVRWPIPGYRKPNALADDASTAKLMHPGGTYVLVKRFSSKEETRRVVACVYRREDVQAERVGFENHLNVFHESGHGVDPALAHGLAVWLNSTPLDTAFRLFSGHTQVNATDLRNLRYPARTELRALGNAVLGRDWPDQAEIDELVEQHVLQAYASRLQGARVAKIEDETVQQARRLLDVLGFDAERSNERSALVLLALAQLGPNESWARACDPMLRTVEIMDWIRQHYGRDYKPNTRETIRRFTLHQFIEVGLVNINPDKPDRPVNSPKNCYQLTPQALEVLQAYRSAEFEKVLDAYKVTAPGLVETYAASRKMQRIPVTLPNGEEVTLSPGGQNELIRDMIHEFCPRYTPGGQVLYVGDADAKWLIYQAEALEKLGLRFDEHGKMPDLVVYMPDKNWLVLLEAASSHGPVDAKRHGELKTLFAGSTAGPVYVSCFPTRAEMRKYLKDIAWETEVWCADAPDHMIHFNGERFLGPYETV